MNSIRSSAVPSPADLVAVQRHLLSLSEHVKRLELENSRRWRRELLLYPLLLGYAAIHLARWLISSKWPHAARHWSCGGLVSRAAFCMNNQTPVVVDLLAKLLYFDDNSATGSTAASISYRMSRTSWKRLNAGYHGNAWLWRHRSAVSLEHWIVNTDLVKKKFGRSFFIEQLVTWRHG